ncbi:MAG: T9SS type A sorting domain-containing protein [Bacteroidetes bacterium]|nr:T9SS type A sorting domain-containing protein [Bacteroidota bacterium]
MKKLLLICFSLSFVFSIYAQQRTVPTKAMRDFAVRKGQPVHFETGFEKTAGIPALKSVTEVEEEIIGATRYDLQSNASCQNRLHVFEDGTIGATWTMGFEDPGFSDRGTGYNYFDGSEWGEIPTQHIESLRTGWPSYAPYGENGELVVSHDFGPAPAGDPGTLRINIRDTKGSGVWAEDVFYGPDIEISWPRATTSGIDNSVIQMLAITWPTPNGGPVYEGLDGALLYSRSADGGATWDPQNMILEGISSDYYFGFSADDYDWAASQGDNIAFLAGNSWYDFILMKSTDGGDTWEKTVIWEHPYPFFSTTTPIETDTFYCVDGAHHLAFDSQGKVHVVFGINRAYADAAGTYWFPLVDGVGYWNEDMPTFSNDLNALNPYGEAGTELVEDESLIGWWQDLNNNGEWDILGEVGAYYISASGMPQIVIDDMDYIYLVFSGVTESYNNGAQDFRHIWARGSWGEGVWGDFIDLTGDLIHIFDECVFPSAAPATDDYFYLMFQTDAEPGLAVRGDEDPYTDNNMYFMKVSRNDLIPVGVEELSEPITAEGVSQNMPNPFTGTSWVNIEVQKTCDLSLEVTNITGQVVYAIAPKEFQAGSYRLPIHAENLTKGVYFYTVKAGDTSVTKKMIVE